MTLANLRVHAALPPARLKMHSCAFGDNNRAPFSFRALHGATVGVRAH